MLNYSARRVALLAAVLGVAFVTTACGERPTASYGEPVILAAPVPSTVPRIVPADPTGEQQMTVPATPDGGGAPQSIDPAAMSAAAANVEPNTTLGAVVFDRVTGQTPLALEADRQFRSASLVKLMIAIDMLRSGAADRERITRMLTVSDDDIASALWVKGGQEDIIRRVAPVIGLQSTEPPEDPGQWGEVKLTPNDVVRVYQYVMTALTPEDSRLIVDALAHAPRHAADGWDQHFGIPSGLRYDWAIKQGWGNNDHTMVLHSTGLVGAKWRYVVVLLSEHPLGSGWRTSEDAVTAAAKTLDGLLPGA